MKVFELDKDALRKAWSGAEQYWFYLEDYKIKDITTLPNNDSPENTSQTSFFVSMGYIPYVCVSNIEVMRAYVETLENKKLKEAHAQISDDEYVEAFWKYFKIYPDLFEGYKDFEDTYVLEKVKSWCEENSINYEIK